MGIYMHMIEGLPCTFLKLRVDAACNSDPTILSGSDARDPNGGNG